MQTDTQIKTTVIKNLQANYERDMARLHEVSAKLALVLANAQKNA
jgi:hypothetical protein